MALTCLSVLCGIEGSEAWPGAAVPSVRRVSGGLPATVRSVAAGDPGPATAGPATTASGRAREGPPRSSSPEASGRGGRSAVWPLDPVPRVVRRFHLGPLPWSPGHRGVDLAAADGQRVVAALDGTVSFSGRVVDRSVVSVRHGNGLRTTYGPVRPAVVRGQRVGRGEPLGTVVPGHCATGPCLHWGALFGRTYLDPLTLLTARGRPVLLPVLEGADGPGPEAVS